MREVEFVNSNSRKYLVFIEERKLYLQSNNEINELADNVIEYKLECIKGILWICYFNNKYEVFLVKVKLTEDIVLEVIDYQFLVEEYNFIFIDSLRLLTDSSKNIYIIFRGWLKNQNESLILKIDLLSKKEVKIVAKTISERYSTPVITYSNGYGDIIIYCNNQENGEYYFYNLKDEKVIGVTHLKDICDISLIKYNNNSVIIYNKIINKNLILNYKFLREKQGEFIIDIEKRIGFHENIIKPQVSVYFSKVYLIWNSSGILNVATTRDLERWKLKSFNRSQYDNLIKASLTKIIDGCSEKIKTYIDSLTIEKILENTSNYCEQLEYIKSKDSIVLPEVMESDLYIKKASSFTSRIELQREHYELLNNYGKKVSELQKIIDEKDRIISKLLNMK